MLQRQMGLRIALMAALVVIGILAGPWLVGALSGVAYSESVAAPVEQVEPAAPATHTCDIREVAVFDNRVHVLCYSGGAPGGAILFFAAPTSDVQRSARLLTMMLAAQTSGRQLRVGYDTTASGAGFGCLTSNCRPIDYLIVIP